MHVHARLALNLLLFAPTLLAQPTAPTAAVPGKTTGTFGTCDPAIHDKLVGAEWRSPSECEVKFDAYVRQGLTAALEPVIANLTAHGWSVVNKVESQTMTSIPRHTETKPYQLEEQQMHQGAPFYVQFALSKSSPAYERYDKPVRDAMKKFSDLLKSGNMAAAKAATDEMHDAAKAQEEHTTCVINLQINQGNVGISTFSGGHTVMPLASGGFAVSAPNVQPATGGDESGGQRVTYVFFGAFAQPASGGSTRGEENVQVKGTLNQAKLLAVQNVRIRVQTGVELADQVIKLIDWKAIEALIQSK